MYSTSQQKRRLSFFTLWKESIHPFAELSEDMKRLLYPDMRGYLYLEKSSLELSSDLPDWVEYGVPDVNLCLEKKVQHTNWQYDNTEVHALFIQQSILFLWVDIKNRSDILEIIDIVNFQIFQNKNRTPTWKLAFQFGFQKVLERETYIVSIVVGTLITLYGQLLVPFLRYEKDVWETFVVKLVERPKLTIFSILLAYLFPIGVQIHATIVARMREYRTNKRKLQ